MSHLHKIPDRDILREEALEAAEEYSIRNKLSISKLTLVSIILPEQSAIKELSKTYRCFCSWCEDFVCPCYETYQDILDRDDCDIILENFMESTQTCITKSVCWVFNFYYLYDEIRSVYQEGILVYKRKIDELSVNHFCIYSVRDMYQEYDSSLHFYPWEPSLINTYPHYDGLCLTDSKKFHELRIEYNWFLHKKTTITLLKQLEEEFNREISI
eukprot:snap_masked-scaffold_3-processed-gene-12.22-mRNA-1 protein AED:1.00 eAED:1.00 QI:0/0/0/0/1/1/2/0/213